MYKCEIVDQSSYHGFHVSKAHGLDYAQRAEDHFSYPHRCYYYNTSDINRLLCPPRTDTISVMYLYDKKLAPTDSLRDSLRSNTVATIQDFARKMGMYVPSGLRKAALVDYVADHVLQSTEAFEKALRFLDDDLFDAVRSLLAGTEVSAPPQATGYVPVGLYPFVYGYENNDERRLVMSRQAREALADLDLEALDRSRRVNHDLERLLFNYTALGGVTRMADLYAGFQTLDTSAALDESEFTEAVRRRSGYASTYRMVTIGRESYVESVQLKDSKLSSKTLAQRHDGLMARAATDALADKTVADYVYGLDCVRQLTDYFDTHVPIHEDDWNFAYKETDAIIGDFMFGRATLSNVLGRLTKKGWYLAEGSNAAPKLTQLVCKLYREIPRWEFNGWSEQEVIDMQGLPCLIGESLKLGLTNPSNPEDETYELEPDEVEYDCCERPSVDEDMPEFALAS